MTSEKTPWEERRAWDSGMLAVSPTWGMKPRMMMGMEKGESDARASVSEDKDNGVSTASRRTE